MDRTPSNLPVQLTGFIGRARELAETKDLLGSHPLLTLTGAGAAGGTRLSIRLLADDVAAAFPDACSPQSTRKDLVI